MMQISDRHLPTLRADKIPSILFDRIVVDVHQGVGCGPNRSYRFDMYIRCMIGAALILSRINRLVLAVLGSVGLTPAERYVETAVLATPTHTEGT
jgi:hypothetical protein